MVTETRKSSQRGKRKQPQLELIGLRINSGWSREMLAARIGVSRETIRLGEDGYVPTPRIQFAWAAQFNRLPLDLWPIERQRAGR